jgi:hypothetical protein
VLEDTIAVVLMVIAVSAFVIFVFRGRIRRALARRGQTRLDRRNVHAAELDPLKHQVLRLEALPAEQQTAAVKQELGRLTGMIDQLRRNELDDTLLEAHMIGDEVQRTLEEDVALVADRRKTLGR